MPLKESGYLSPSMFWRTENIWVFNVKTANYILNTRLSSSFVRNYCTTAEKTCLILLADTFFKFLSGGLLACLCKNSLHVSARRIQTFSVQILQQCCIHPETMCTRLKISGFHCCYLVSVLNVCWFLQQKGLGFVFTAREEESFVFPLRITSKKPNANT